MDRGTNAGPGRTEAQAAAGVLRVPRQRLDAQEAAAAEGAPLRPSAALHTSHAFPFPVANPTHTHTQAHTHTHLYSHARTRSVHAITQSRMHSTHAVADANRPLPNARYSARAARLGATLLTRVHPPARPPVPLGCP